MLLRQAEKGHEHGADESALYRRAMACYESCVALNALQADVWFSLGCCALRVEDFSTAARAFRRRVDIDPDVSLFQAGKRGRPSEGILLLADHW